MHLLQVIVEFVIVLGIMVLVHEFGHFAVAKFFRVRVETFALGFGTRLFGVKHNGTDYCVNLLPFGGYVKFSGDQPGQEASDPGDFNAHPRWQRALIAAAGPAMNFLLAFLLLWVLAHEHHEVDRYLNSPAVLDYVPANTPAARLGLTAGDTLTAFNGKLNPTWLAVEEELALHMGAILPFTFEHNGAAHTGSFPVETGSKGGEFDFGTMLHLGLLQREQAQPIAVQRIEPGSPAAGAGLQAGDRIERVDTLEPHSVQTLLAYLQDRGGAPVTLEVDRHGQQLRLPVTPKKLAGSTGEMQYRLGFAPTPVPADVVKMPLGEAARESVRENAEDSTLILRVLKGMFTRQVAVKSVSGPVGMAQQIDIAVQLGYWTLLRLMSSISINLGILNLMPFPVLDGGMILFLLVEAIMRRDVNQVIKERVYQVAFVCLIVFAVLVMFNDITKLHIRP